MNSFEKRAFLEGFRNRIAEGYNRFKDSHNKQTIGELSTGVTSYIAASGAVGGVSNEAITRLAESAFIQDMSDLNKAEDAMDASRKIKGTAAGALKRLMDKKREVKVFKTYSPGGYAVNTKSLRNMGKVVEKIFGKPAMAEVYKSLRMITGIELKEIIKATKPGAKHLISINNKRGNLGILAHELGHATRFGKDIVSRINDLSIGGASTVLGGAVAALAPEEYSQYGAPIVLAGKTPLLLEEAKASWRGLNSLDDLMRTSKIDKIVRTKAMRSATKQLAKAFGTYGIAAGSAVTIPYIVSKMRSAYKRRYAGI